MHAPAMPLSSRLLQAWNAIRVPVLFATVNRLALWIAAYLGYLWVPGGQRMFPQNAFLESWFRWDAGWYTRIAREGYSITEIVPGQRTVVFFPLFPLSVRAVSQLTGGDVYLAAFLISNVSLLLATIFFYWLVKDRYDEHIARSATALLLCFPYSFYFSTMYAESLYFLGVTMAFWASQRRLWWLAGPAIAAASATRPVGIIAGLGAGLLYLEQIRWRPRALRPDILFLLLGLCGLGGFMLFLHVKFGNAWWWTSGTNAPGWGGGRDFQNFLGTLTMPFRVPSFLAGGYHVADLMHILWLALATVLCVVGARTLGVPYAVYGLAMLVPYWRAWYSASRYVAVLFPIFIVGAHLLRNHPWRLGAIIHASSLLLMLFAFLYGHGYWVS
jgi:hypothetical protein